MDAKVEASSLAEPPASNSLPEVSTGDGQGSQISTVNTSFEDSPSSSGPLSLPAQRDPEPSLTGDASANRDGLALDNDAGDPKAWASPALPSQEPLKELSSNGGPPRVRVMRSMTLGSAYATKGWSGSQEGERDVHVMIQDNLTSEEVQNTGDPRSLRVLVGAPAAEDEPAEGSTLFPIASAREGRKSREGRFGMLSALTKLNRGSPFQSLGSFRRKESSQNESGGKFLLRARSQAHASQSQGQSPRVHPALPSADVQELQRTVQALQAELAFLQENRSIEKGHVSRLQGSNSGESLTPSPSPSPLGSSSSASVHAEDIASLQAELTALRTSKSMFERKSRSIENENAALKMQLSKVEDEKVELETRLETAEEERYVIRTKHEQEVSRLESRVDSLVEQNNNLEMQVSSAEKQVHHLEEKLLSSEKERSRLQKKVDELSLSAAEEENLLLELLSQKLALVKERNELSVQLTAARKEIGLLVDTQNGPEHDNWMKLALGKWSHGECR